MPRISGPPDGEGVQAAVLPLRVLDYVTRQKGSVGVTELSVALQTPKSRIHRHMRTLVEQEYLVHSRVTERYRIGPKLLTLGRLTAERTELLDKALPTMMELRDLLGHAVVLAQYESEGVCILEAVLGKASIGIGVRKGSMLDFHSSAQGKVTLAYAEPAFRERILRRPLTRFSSSTIVDPDELRVHLSAVRQQGWSVSPGETLLGINALAAPIFDPDGLLTGTLAVVDSEHNLGARPQAAQIAAVVGAARKIIEALRRTA